MPAGSATPERRFPPGVSAKVGCRDNIGGPRMLEWGYLCLRRSCPQFGSMALSTQEGTRIGRMKAPPPRPPILSCVTTQSSFFVLLGCNVKHSNFLFNHTMQYTRKPGNKAQVPPPRPPPPPKKKNSCTLTPREPQSLHVSRGLSRNTPSKGNRSDWCRRGAGSPARANHPATCAGPWNPSVCPPSGSMRLPSTPETTYTTSETPSAGLPWLSRFCLLPEGEVPVGPLPSKVGFAALQLLDRRRRVRRSHTKLTIAAAHALHVEVNTTLSLVGHPVLPAEYGICVG